MTSEQPYAKDGIKSEPWGESGEKLIADLLLDLFEDNRAVLRFLDSSPATQVLSEQVPDVSVPRASFNFETARALDRHGLVSEELFRRLALCFPTQSNRLSRTAARVGVGWAPPVLRVAPERAQAPRRHALLALLALMSGAWSDRGPASERSLCAWPGALPVTEPEIAIHHPVTEQEIAIAPMSYVEPIGPVPGLTETSELESDPSPDPTCPEKQGAKRGLRTGPRSDGRRVENKARHEPKSRQVRFRLTSPIDGMDLDVGRPRRQSCENAAEDLFHRNIQGNDTAPGRKRFESDTFELCQDGRCCDTQSIDEFIVPNKSVQLKRNGHFQNSPENTPRSIPENRALPR